MSHASAIPQLEATKPHCSPGTPQELHSIACNGMDLGCKRSSQSLQTSLQLPLQQAIPRVSAMTLLVSFCCQPRCGKTGMHRSVADHSRGDNRSATLDRAQL